MMFEDLKLTDNADIAQREVAYYLECLGYDVEWEVKVPGGRIDLVAHHPLGTIAIEVDRVNPRIGSLAKLRAYDCDVRYVICRRGKVHKVAP
jgi:hypothetical protein